MNVSVSRINTMGFCARAHYYQYTLSLEPKQASGALDLGKLVHACIEDFYKTGVMPRVDDDLGEVGDKAKSAIQSYAFLAKLKDNFTVVDVEKRFDVPLEDIGVTFVGVIDAVVRVDGQLWLLEHKTCSQHWSDERLAMANQHVLYELVAEELYGEPVAGTMYNFLRTTKRGGEFHTDAKRVYIPANHAARTEAYEDLGRKVEAIKSDYKARNPGQHCTYCSALRLCHSDYIQGDTDYLISEFYKKRERNDTVEENTGN